MKRILSFVLALLTVLVFSSCTQTNITESSTEALLESSSFESLIEKDFREDYTRIIKTLDYKNSGKMGDTDGPAFAVYSQIGYNGASIELDLGEAEINTVLPDGRYVNAYTFLGVDIYEGAYWQNCVDAGLCWSGTDGGWHLFYNIYETLNPTTSSWYESRKILPKNASYKLTFTITDDNYGRLTVQGITNGFKDSVKIELKGAKKDGSNTSFLFNTALDYPPDTKLDSSGNPSENWIEITLANSDKGLYFKGLHAENATLFQNGRELTWESSFNSAVSIWPDKAVKGFDYSPVEVYLFDGSEFYINLDMNRK